jgi:hypothetical protein
MAFMQSQNILLIYAHNFKKIQPLRVNVISWSGSQLRKYEPYSNHYTPSWIDHPNLKYGQPSNQQPFWSYANDNPTFPPQTSNSGMYLEEIVKFLATNIQMFQQETIASIQNLET